MITKKRVSSWRVVFDGPDPLAIARAAQAIGWGLSSGTIQIDNEAGGLDLVSAMKTATRGVSIRTNLGAIEIDINAGSDWQPCVRLRSTNVDVDLANLPEQLAGIPYEVAIFGSLVTRWPDAYRGPHWPGGLGPIGWAVAFRGVGHDRMPSRNWFERGPWRSWRGPNDVTLLQFHDLDADAERALAEARPGHARIDVSSGAYMQKDYIYKHELRGVYFQDTETMRVIIHGREITDRELRDWAAARTQGKYQRIAFVFMIPDEARAHLPRLWRYGHEVWAMVDGEERRLDEGYAPPDETPAWAR